MNTAASKKAQLKSQKNELNERDTTIADKEKKIAELSLEAKKLEGIITKQELEKQKFRDDIFECLNNFTDYKKLKREL